jgi:hypothetical protein
MSVIYIDTNEDYPELLQPRGEFVVQAEEEREGEEVTWPQIHKRAWELQQEYDADLAYQQADDADR